MAPSGAIPRFSPPALGTPTTLGTLQPGAVAVIADAQGPAMLVRVRDPRVFANVPGLALMSDGDVFLEATVDLDVLRDVSGLSIVWKTFGAQEIVSGAWPPNRLDLRDLTLGIHSGEVGYDAPAAGQVLLRVLDTLPANSPQFELRAAPVATAAPLPAAVSGDWTGLAWDAPGVLPAPIGGSATPSDVAVVPGGYVAVGSVSANRSVPAAAAATWWSSDGVTWTRTFLDAPRGGQSGMAWVRALGGRLVAIGTSGVQHCGAGEGATCEPLPIAIWTSGDGRAWRRVTTPASFAGATLLDVEVGSGGLLAIGDTGWDHAWLWRSADSVSWTRESVEAGAHLRAVAAVPTGWVIVGSVGGAAPTCCINSGPTGGPVAWFSADGVSWSRATTTNPVTGRGELASLSVGADGMVAMEDVGGGQGGSIRWTSVDGRAWTNTPWTGSPGQPVRYLASDGARMVGVGWANSGPEPLFVSTDGATWRGLPPSGAVEQAPSADPSSNALLQAAHLTSNGLVAVGWDGASGSGLVWVAHAAVAP